MNFKAFFNKSLFLSIPVFQKILSSVIGSSAWLIDALPLDVYGSKSKRLRHLVNEIYAEISQQIKISSPARTKEAIKTVLINLWNAAYHQKPVRYSRDRSAYKSARRYGQLFFKYDRLLPVIDTMENLGYLNQKPGFRVFDKEFGFQTRMWASEQLVQRFETAGLCQYGFFNEIQPDEPIILKDDKKKKIQYIDTPGISRRRKQLKQYNDFINNSKITVVLNSEVLVSIRFLVLFLYQYVTKGTVRINSVNLIQPNTPTQYSIQNYINNNYIYYHYYLLYTMTQRERWNRLSLKAINDSLGIEILKNYVADINVIARGFSDRKHAEAYLNQEYPLKEIGVERLEFQLVYEALHRVYNRGKFNCGGRAYGALHQSLPKEIRYFIHIDGQETVELDFSAYHILMLYHMEGIDYQQDPYTICEDKGMRKVYKAVGLIAINAENEKSAYGAIREELADRGLPLPKRHKQPFVSLVNTFKQAHTPIEKYLFSDVGTKLQNKDSDIMNAILVRLMDMGIIGLSVYDSVIVQAQHKDAIEAVMMEEYKKQMGFKPVIDIK